MATKHFDSPQLDAVRLEEDGVVAEAELITWASLRHREIAVPQGDQGAFVTVTAEMANRRVVKLPCFVRD